MFYKACLVFAFVRPNDLHIYSGAPAGFENLLCRGAWSKEDGGRRVAVGGADRTVTIWEAESGRVLYKVRGLCFCLLSTDDFAMNISCQATKAQSRRLTSIPRNPSVGLFRIPSQVMTNFLM